MMKRMLRIQVASDVVRDGLGLELIDEQGSCVAEVFRCDADNSLSVWTCANGVPADALKELMEKAWRRLAEFEDGSPLDAATNFGRLLAK